MQLFLDLYKVFLFYTWVEIDYVEFNKQSGNFVFDNVEPCYYFECNFSLGQRKLIRCPVENLI